MTLKMSSKGSKKKYPIYNPLAFCLMWGIDWCLRLCITPFLKKGCIPATPSAILVCNTAHLGDVILTTALLPLLRHSFPGVKIGMLVGSQAKPLLEEHPLVNSVHLIDHWKICRSNRTFLQKIVRYLRMRKAVRKEIGEYAVAIDCGLHFPNMAPLLFSAGIPIRIGFTTAGFSPLLTHSLPWNPSDNCPAQEAYCSLLGPFHLPPVKVLRPILPFSLLKERTQSLVFHIGAGSSQKQWPEAHWRELATRLTEEGKQLIFTGKGEAEEEAIERIRRGLPLTQNLCNKLSWKEWVETIQRAALLVAPDTCAGHIAALVHTPAVLLYSGIHPPKLWQPQGGKMVCLTLSTPCSPCLKGCRSMTCIRSLSVETVYAAIKKSLP